jgi:hydroxymethylbilane synthase
LIIASRRSVLARAQAQAIGSAIAARHPRVTIEYRWIESEADQLADVPLADAGGKGLFARAVERVVSAGEADLAIHSLKDLPAHDAPGSSLQITAVPRRADFRDCLVSRTGCAGIADLPAGARLATASPRRAAQARRLRPDLAVELIRGSIETRLRKVLEDPGGPDATFLAVAGLGRANLAQHATHALSPDLMLPAAGQGALALQSRVGDHATLLRCLQLNDPITAATTGAERAVVAGLGGDCHSPIAVLAEVLESGDFRLRARVLSLDGRACAQADEVAPRQYLAKLVERVLAILRDQGAAEILRPPAPATPAGPPAAP